MLTRRNSRCNLPHRRQGAILVVAMICLLLASLLLGSLLKFALVQRTQARLEQHRLQADWLAEAGLERAVARLTTDAAYSSEVWNVSAEELGGLDAGQVEIAVETPADAQAARIVTVVSIYPTDSIRFAKRTKQATVSVEPER